MRRIISKTSTDSALRDIKDLIGKGILQQTNEALKTQQTIFHTKF